MSKLGQERSLGGGSRGLRGGEVLDFLGLIAEVFLEREFLLPILMAFVSKQGGCSRGSRLREWKLLLRL